MWAHRVTIDREGEASMSGKNERGDELPGRDRAWALLNEYTKKPGLIAHALAVESAMRAYARKLGHDEDIWGLVGLLHDFDYERWPTAEDHPFRGAEILEQQDYPEWFRKAILSHASYSGVPRETTMEKVLFACDELCGFLTACALVTPDKSIHAVKVKSVRKKMKSKAFAASVNREDIIDGAAEIGVELAEHIGLVIEAMRGVAPQLGLEGPGSGVTNQTG
jgi:putative nucleotidyltransferase with HDIG domain